MTLLKTNLQKQISHSGGSRDGGLIHPIRLYPEADETHFFHFRMLREEPGGFGDGDAGGAFQWKAVDAGADGGEGDGADGVLYGESEAIPVTARQ